MDPQVKNVLIQLSNLGEAKAAAERDLQEGRIDSARYQQIRQASGEQIAQCHRTLAQMPEQVASAQAEVDTALARCREELATLDNDTKLGLLTPARADQRREPLAARQVSLEQVHQELTRVRSAPGGAAPAAAPAPGAAAEPGTQSPAGPPPIPPAAPSAYPQTYAAAGPAGAPPHGAAAAPAKPTRPGKLFGWCTWPAGLMLAGLFFLPWVDVSCGFKDIAHASGLQLSVGDYTADSLLPAESVEKLPKSVRARPWFFLGLGLPLALAVLGGLAAVEKLGPIPFGAAATILAIAGLTVTILASSVDYASEFKDVFKDDSTPGKAVPTPPPNVFPRGFPTPTGSTADAIHTSLAGGAQGCIFFWVLVAVAGALSAIMGYNQSKAQSAANRPPG